MCIQITFMRFVISMYVFMYSVTMHLLHQICVMITCFVSCDVFQVVCIMCIFNIFLWNCNRIYVDKASNVVFSEIKS